MPQYGKKRAFQLGKYFLGKQARSPAWCRCYYDPVSGQTKRRSLLTTDFEEAKVRLNQWYILNHNAADEPFKEPKVTIAQCLARYWENHAKNLTSAESARIAITRWLEFFDDTLVDDLHDIPLQERFHRSLRERGMGASSVKRIVAIGSAAINMAHKRGDIKHLPHILTVKTPKGQATPPPKGRPLEQDEIIALFEAAHTDSLRLFLLYGLATGARPDAILDLSLTRCDIENRLIDLLPRGRNQTTKHRPTIKMPEAIVPLTQKLKSVPHKEFVIGIGDEPQKSIRTAWRRARTTAKLDDQVNPYSLRHTIGRWLRQQGVDAWEVSAQLGHKRSGMDITERYASFDPRWQSDSRDAIDLLFGQLRVKSVVLKNFMGG